MVSSYTPFHFFIYSPFKNAQFLGKTLVFLIIFALTEFKSVSEKPLLKRVFLEKEFEFKLFTNSSLSSYYIVIVIWMNY